MVIVLFIFLLVLSAFFSSSETAFFNIKKHHKISNRVKYLLKNPRELLTFILIGNTLVNIAIATLAANYTINVLVSRYSNFSKEELLFYEVIIVTLVVLVFGEIIPKSYAIKQSKSLANLFSFPIRFIMKLFYPISFLVFKITDSFLKIVPLKKERVFDSEEELKLLTEIVEKEGTIHESESNMIQSVFEFNDKIVKEILTPRVDVFALEQKANLDDAMDLIASKKFSKIPVYQDNIDNIKGVLYAKDIISYLMGSRPKINLIKLSRAPFFIPETKPIDELLDDFKIKKKNIAIVVDEWGGTSGIITLEDVVEEVMGELRDPYDEQEYLFIQKNDSTYIADGAIKIYDLEENMDLEFPDDRDYDTLAGFILDSLGNIPETGEFATYMDYIFTVISLNQNRIDKVEIRKK